MGCPLFLIGGQKDYGQSPAQKLVQVSQQSNNSSAELVGNLEAHSLRSLEDQLMGADSTICKVSSL